jgi:Tfp pilus assembly protein PilN
MINLLPSEDKKKLVLEEKKSLAKVWGLIVLVSLICLVLILLSIRFYILSETDYQKIILEQAQKEDLTMGLEKLNSDVQKYNGILEQLNSFYKKEVYYSQILEDINNILHPDGLYLTNFSLTRDKNAMIKISLSGYSNTRENLLVFKKNIEQDQKIKNPSFSPTSWVKPKDVDFSLTLEINPIDYQNERK